MAYTFKHGDRPVEGYTIQRAVGKGGFGEVYYAISDGGREVALKYLRDNPQVELRGVSHCINLKSPHLVSIFDVKKTTDGEYAIIMEYCSGPSLRDLLVAEPNGFGPQKAAFFLREIAKGMSYLHDRGIVHRDLKPGNLFYDDGYVKIGDYGLSKFIAISRHSGQTASVGTVHYMAPEIGSGNYSRGVDIYALGVMLYEMLLGKVPFEGSTMAEVLMKHLTTQPELDELPQPFGNVIRKALQKDPNDRYQTVDEMVDDVMSVDEVRQSVAGFQTQSLDGAVRHAGGALHASPVPSPNPPRGFAPNVPPPPVGGQQPPFAQPLPPEALPERLAKRMDRISRRVNKRMQKLGRRHQGPGMPAPTPQAPPPTPQRDTGPALNAANTSGPEAPTPQIRNRGKRILLSAILALGLATGLGIVAAQSTGSDDVGFATSFLVLGMAGGVVGSRSVIRWFDAEEGPKWAQRMITAACCAPLMAISLALYESDEGGAIMLGLLIVATFARWDKTLNKASSGELGFGSVIWIAIGAMLCSLAAFAAFTGGEEPEPTIMLAGGIAGAVSLIVQAASWWMPMTATQFANRHSTRTRQPQQEPGAHNPYEAQGVQPPPPPVGYRSDGAPMTPTQAYGDPAQGSIADQPLRWAMTRAFWGIVAFLLMGGAIVTFLIPLVTANFHYHEITGSIIGCIACASFMLFALRKTTPIKRDGFWRESLRPFMISATMLGIGAAITGIAREWGHRSYCSWQGELERCVPDIGRVGIVAGLVMCSLLFLTLSLFTGRKRRVANPSIAADGYREVQGTAKPFLLGTPAGPDAGSPDADEHKPVT